MSDEPNELFDMPLYDPDSWRMCRRCGHASPHRIVLWSDVNARPGVLANPHEVSECAECSNLAVMRTTTTWPVTTSVADRAPLCTERDRWTADLQWTIRTLQDKVRELQYGG